MTPLTDQLLTVADAFCKARKLSRARVSTLIFNDGKKLDLIEGGADLGTKGFERAMGWFSAEWPADTKWPREIKRPEPLRVAS